MLTILSAILFTSVAATILCIVCADPLVRAAERSHKLDDVQGGLKKAQDDLLETRKILAGLEFSYSALQSEAESIERDIRAAEKRVKAIRVEPYELVFEIGIEEPGMSRFNFYVSRGKRDAAENNANHAEQALWGMPRLVTVWARSQNLASTAALRRFPSTSGFMLRLAEAMPDHISAPAEKVS